MTSPVERVNSPENPDSSKVHEIVTHRRREATDRNRRSELWAEVMEMTDAGAYWYAHFALGGETLGSARGKMSELPVDYVRYQISETEE